ncbi:hypothetical protein HYV73_02570, partial [Candidatus Uhrbacteria bacterium]|nr:hypothetical protein [Candidatus Uhrbacteria bacterium]
AIEQKARIAAHGQFVDTTQLRNVGDPFVNVPIYQKRKNRADINACVAMLTQRLIDATGRAGCLAQNWQPAEIARLVQVGSAHYGVNLTESWWTIIGESPLTDVCLTNRDCYLKHPGEENCTATGVAQWNFTTICEMGGDNPWDPIQSIGLFFQVFPREPTRWCAWIDQRGTKEQWSRSGCGKNLKFQQREKSNRGKPAIKAKRDRRYAER